MAKDLFVPDERVLPMGPVLQGEPSAVRNADSAIYRAPFLPAARTTVTGVALGLAKELHGRILCRQEPRVATGVPGGPA